MNGVTATKWLKRLAAAGVTLAAAGAFLGLLPADVVLKIQPSATWTFLVVFALALVVGRLFCECFCPLGAVQSFVHWALHPKRHVRRVCTRLPETRAQRIVRWSIVAISALLLAAGLGSLAWTLTPYSIFGKALTLFVPGLVLFGVVVMCAALGKGRAW